MKKIHITSLGCAKNFVDSEVILGQLQHDDWQAVEQPEQADILLVNTCGFIQPAVEEGVDAILELADIKKNAPAMKLVVSGCMVQRYREKLKEEIPEIDLLVGTEGVENIQKLFNALVERVEIPLLHMPQRFLMDHQIPRTLATPSFRAWMKITEGCNNCCSYCMIPSIRGPLRSRSLDDLQNEAVILEQKGVREVSLIAQDLTAYGCDGRDGDNNQQLVPLLHRLVDNTTINWIRLLYLYPTGITDELLDLMAKNNRIVPYLDIPFQHASTRVLHRMNRLYSHEMLFSLIQRIRTKLPEAALRTTFLLGFPGEKDADVEDLGSFLEEVKLDHVGVFAYSNEEGSASEFYDDQISEEEKHNRVEYIHTLQSSISAEIQKKYVGTVQDVLVEGLSRETDLLLEGRTRFQAPDIDGCVLINDGQARPGDFVQVEVSEAQTYDLVGGIVPSVP
ncbi:MAG: 30S ribosomal protein S12 methylthiotransferase RimO [Desulfopila sp.]